MPSGGVLPSLGSRSGLHPETGDEKECVVGTQKSSRGKENHICLGHVGGYQGDSRVVGPYVVYDPGYKGRGHGGKIMQ